MKSFLFLLLISCSAWAGPFECDLFVTRQDPSMDWWYAVPENYPPQISRISKVNKGEYFRIIPVFRNFKTDLGNAAQLIFDVKVTGPDGTVHLDLPKLEGHIGLAVSTNLLPAQAVINMCFDPDDPWGRYTIDVTAVDHISNVTNRQQTSLQLQPFEVEKLNEDERGRLFLSYCTSPDPAKALSAFLQTEQPFFDEKREPIWSAVWFFKTIFEQNEFLLPLMMKEYGFSKPKQKQDIILMAVLLGKADQLPRLDTEMRRVRLLMEAGRVPDPYDEITSGKQLDMLWAEFFATGTVKPIRQIVGSLALVDHLGTLDKINAGELDSEQLDVYRKGMLEAVFQSALVSLKNNCIQVPLIFQYCVGILESEELEKPVKSCLAMLLESIEAETPVKKEKEGSDERNYNHN